MGSEEPEDPQERDEPLRSSLVPRWLALLVLIALLAAAALSVSALLAP